MKQRANTHPTLQQRLKQVKRQTHVARYQLQRKVKTALGPLDIQETRGISQVQGDVLFISYHANVRRSVEEVLRGEGYRYDVVNAEDAPRFLQLARYRLVIFDWTSRGYWRIFNDVRRHKKHIKIVVLVTSEARAQGTMKGGGYSYVWGEDFDPEQLRTCLRSALQLRHPVCALLKNGEPCNRSCVYDYEPGAVAQVT
ncbi:hypothetical protein C6499_10895 [Candidatus Poribacteria bacterium]|nr:MAG: hypothetical protein C6499_10895 [Candidatus Poribacteria bacterium]